MSSRPIVLSIIIGLTCFGSSLDGEAIAEGTAASPTTAAPATVQASTPAVPPAATPPPEPASSPELPAPAQTPVAEGPSLIDLVQTTEYKSVWAMIFKGEYSPSRWIETLDATSTPLTEVKANGKTYFVGSMYNANNPKGNKFIVAFNADHKKGWGVELTVPAGIGRDAVLHPKKYAAIRYFNNPDIGMKKLLMDYLGSKEPNWK